VAIRASREATPAARPRPLADTPVSKEDIQEVLRPLPRVDTLEELLLEELLLEDMARLRRGRT